MTNSASWFYYILLVLGRATHHCSVKTITCGPRPFLKREIVQYYFSRFRQRGRDRARPCPSALIVHMGSILPHASFHSTTLVQPELASPPEARILFSKIDGEVGFNSQSRRGLRYEPCGVPARGGGGGGGGGGYSVWKRLPTAV